MILNNIFLEIPCLEEKSPSLKGYELQKQWFKNTDKRIIGIYLQKFIEYNEKLFSFLGIHAYIEGSDHNSSIYFTSSQYIGAIPLKAPDTGKQIGDFIIAPRYIGKSKYSEFANLLILLKGDIDIEFAESLPLISNTTSFPPSFLESLKFVHLLNDALKKHWLKFKNTEITHYEPSGEINWKRYLEKEFDPKCKLKFPISKNILTEKHSEFAQIKFVFEICKKDLLSSSTPFYIKARTKHILSLIEAKFQEITQIKTNHIITRAADTQLIKKLKNQANIILSKNYMVKTGWRTNFSIVFERYIQHLFKEAAKETGGTSLSNPKLHRKSGTSLVWDLRYLEPDAIYTKQELMVFVDAKYKSHLYNKNIQSEFLKAEYRKDIHQIISYLSFSNTQNKFGILCYPSNYFQEYNVIYSNNLNGVENSIRILGIPCDTSKLLEIKGRLITILTQYETVYSNLIIN